LLTAALNNFKKDPLHVLTDAYILI